MNNPMKSLRSYYDEIENHKKIVESSIECDLIIKFKIFASVYPIQN